MNTAVLAWLRLVRVFQKIDRVSTAQMRCRNLSVAQFEVLAHVDKRAGVTQQDLADALLVTKGNVCQLLDRMEQNGLIRRQQDGRANRLRLTDQGEQLFAELAPRHEELIAERFAALSEDEQRQLLGLLRKLDHALT